MNHGDSGPMGVFGRLINASRFVLVGEAASRNYISIVPDGSHS
jgi:hypothetical protein